MSAAVSPILDALYHGQGAEAQRLASQVGSEHLSIHEAAALGNLDRVQHLVTADPTQANAWAVDGFQPLGLACFFGHRPAAELLLARGAEVNAAARNSFQVAALHAALAGPDPDIARSLLAAGADANARQQGGVTPLHEAAHLGRLDVVQLLLDHGADASATDDQGRSAADVARERGHAPVADLLAASHG
jgi:ankyrin repeat protein